MEDEVCVVIATFRPPRSLLNAALEAQSTASIVAVVDDASPCTYDEILRDLPPKVVLRRHATNAGIARSLNDGLAIAQEHGASWMLTLDQDSTPHATMLANLLATIRSHSGAPIGVIAPAHTRIAHRDLDYPAKRRDDLLVTHEVIQSGALWNVSALDEVGGFNEELGMDAVDAGACLALRRHGYLVALCDDAGIDHHWGDARWIRFLGRNIAVTNHSSERRATMVRNRLRLAPAEFRESPLHALRTLRRIAMSSVLAGTVEEDSWRKTKATARAMLRPRGR